MKNQTLLNRLTKRFNGSKSSKSFQIVSDLINQTNKSGMINSNIIRPCKTSGSGRFTTNMDYTTETKSLLTLIGVKFEYGNDSLRGGKTGEFIKIITKIN